MAMDLPCNFLQHPPLQLSSLAEWVPLRPGKMDYRVVRKKHEKNPTAK
jgi:hypothetical protein